MELPRTFVLTVDRPIQRFDDTAEHLNSLGIKWERFNGFDNQLCQLLPVRTFDLDRVGEKIGPKHICATLSHYMLWKVCSYLPEDRFLICEYDVEFPPDWQEQYDRAMSVIPEDADVIFWGSCCTEGRDTKHIGENVYEVKWPLCGHCIEIRKSALPTLLSEHQSISMPLDIALFYNSLPKLRVYTVLPAMIGQRGTPLPI